MKDMKKKASGFTLIEMLVGIVIGMIVVAAASVMMVSVLKSQKDVTASARLNQELGAAMAVISNEIRRAGFNVCDIKKMHGPPTSPPTPPTDSCPDYGKGEAPYIHYNTSASNKDIEIFDIIDDKGDNNQNGKGDCILYRYNADMDKENDIEELRGFRFIKNSDNIGILQISQSDNTTAVACNNNAKWVSLTDPNIININLQNSQFSTTASKCRNMTLPDPIPGSPLIVAQYWMVTSANEIVQACISGGDNVKRYIVTEDSSDPLINNTAESIGGKIFTNSGDELFGTRQIKIQLDAELSRDTTVTKRLESSVKVANPHIEPVP